MNVLEMKCLRSFVGVSRMDRDRNEEVRWRAGIEIELPRRADQRLLRWFGHVERMDDRVSYSQKGVDGVSKWQAGTRETEVRLDRWCEGGFGQQRNAGGGCSSMRERLERVESLACTYVTEWLSTACVLSDRPSRASVVITWRGVGCRYMMRLG